MRGKRVLLTGATGGIGQAIARALAARGARLTLTARRAEILRDLAGELGATTIAADLTDPASIATLIHEAGRVDILVANAALPSSGLITDFTAEEIDRALAVNLRAPILLSRELSAAMSARRSGHIVLISSLAGKVAAGGASLYSATKFGLRGFGIALREDLRPHGVGVSVIYPGFIRDAGMFADSGVELPRGVGTRTPTQVATAVVRAIERNRGEVDVAPLGLRVGSLIGGIAPGTVAAVNRRLGGARVAENLAEGQRDKR
ncbi:MAG: SDR family NAD(P)-dependent oxidoreductase [Candidatus Dormibacteria bacterium]